MNSVVVQFKWTVEDLLLAQQWHFRHLCRAPFRWAVQIVIGLIMAVSVSSLVQVGYSAIPTGFLIAGFYLYAIRPYEVRWLARRRFAKRPDCGSELQWTFSPEGIHTVSPHGRSEFQWTALSKVIRTPDGFLFYPTDQIFHFLPRRGFRDELDFQRLSALAEAHAREFILV